MVSLSQQINRQIKKAYLAAAAALVAEQVSLDQLDRSGLNPELPIFTVSQVAAVADIHPQTLRQYDRMNLIVPSRTQGGARRYSLRDVDRLAQAQRMAQEENINLAGIARILALSEENRQLRRQIERLKRAGDSIFAAAADGEVVEIRRTHRDWRANIARPLLLTASVEELTRDSEDPVSNKPDTSQFIGEDLDAVGDSPVEDMTDSVINGIIDNEIDDSDDDDIDEGIDDGIDEDIDNEDIQDTDDDTADDTNDDTADTADGAVNTVDDDTADETNNTDGTGSAADTIGFSPDIITVRIIPPDDTAQQEQNTGDNTQGKAKNARKATRKKQSGARDEDF